MKILFKFFRYLALIVIVAMAAWNANFGSKTSSMSDVMLANVEALAQETYDNQSYTCWNNIEGGLSPTRWCTGCEPVWFTTGTNVSTCVK